MTKDVPVAAAVGSRGRPAGGEQPGNDRRIDPRPQCRPGPTPSASVDTSPSPYHAATEALRRLTSAGFHQLPPLAGGFAVSGPGRYTPSDGWRLAARPPSFRPAAPLISPLPDSGGTHRQPGAAGEATPPEHGPGRMRRRARRGGVWQPVAQLLARSRPRPRWPCGRPDTAPASRRAAGPEPAPASAAVPRLATRLDSDLLERSRLKLTIHSGVGCPSE